MTAGTAFDFQQYVASRRAAVEERLAQYLFPDDQELLFQAMRYSALGGGKRLRALLCLSAAEAVGAFDCDPLQTALPCACAIEMVHAMSLIHDDLPCMDDDDYRRGRLTNHKVFGEATALLAGDALLVLSLETLARRSPDWIKPPLLLKVVAELAAVAGAKGLVGGQVDDLLATGAISQASPGPASSPAAASSCLLEKIHQAKTGALLRFSVWSGASLMGADDRILGLLTRFGEILGLAFQIADDMLDVTGDIKALGKTPGKDQAAGKLTWVSLYGMEKSKETLVKLENEGKSLLSKTGLAETSLSPLVCLLEYAIHRMN